MALSMNPLYNLKAVLMETGIKPDVLRAWERRYGVPMPQRSAGGHRLYSEHDIEIIKWLLARQEDGLSISHAVEMWKDHLAKGTDPIETHHEAAQSGAPTLQSSTMVLTGIDDFRTQWINGCLAFNESAVEQVLNQAFAIYPVEFVCTEVLQRGLVEIGWMWYQNRASVQQEHFASALALRRMDALLLSCAAPTRPETVIVGCPAGEWHALIPLMLALFIRRRGCNVIYLGANVPSDQFVGTVSAVNASLVILTAQQLRTAANLQQAAELLASNNIQVAFGGRIFASNPDLVARIPGHYLGSRLDGAIHLVEGLLSSQLPSPRISPVSADYERCLKTYIARRPFVEATLTSEVGQAMSGATDFPETNKHMGDNIIAALRLGSVSYLDGEIDWLKMLLVSYNLPENLLKDYLRTYLGAINQHLNGSAALLAGWFEQQLLALD